MGRAPCCDKNNVKKGPWSPEEDGKLKEFMEKHGTGGNWIALPQKAGLRRCGKSCRLRWLNYLRPNIKHGEFTEHEDRVICTMYGSIGSRWSIIAAQLQGRTDNDIKNYWNTKLKKKLQLASTAGGVPPPPRALRQQQQQQHRSVLLPYSNYNCFFSGAGGSLQPAVEPHFFSGAGGTQDHYMLSSNPFAGNGAAGLQQHHHQVKEEGSSGMIVFGSSDQQSCSSSTDGTAAHCGGGQFGKELSFDGYHRYGYCSNNGAAGEQQEHRVVFQQEEPPPPPQLDYSYEEIKQLLMTATAAEAAAAMHHDHQPAS